jgi:hypothetical protein
MQELCGIDCPIILLCQVMPKLAWPDHHTELRSERHASSRKPRGATTTRGARCRRFSCWRESVELPLDVMTLDVATPLALTLDGDMTIFAIMTMVELGLEVSRSDTCHWCTWWDRRVCS